MFSFFKRLFSLSDDAEEIKEALDNKAFLVDVRTSPEFKSGSVRGAVNIPLSEINRNISKFKGKKNVVVFCRSGARSGHAKRVLEQNDIKNVLNGGSAGNVKSLLNQ